VSIYAVSHQTPLSCSVGCGTDHRRITGVVDVQQVRIEVQVLLLAHLDSGISWLVGWRTRGKVEGRIEGKRGEGDPGEALGGELGLVDDDLLNVRVRRLCPMRCESHFKGMSVGIVRLNEAP